MKVTLRLGGLPIEKIALLQKLAEEIEAPKHWHARFLIRGVYHRPTEHTAWTANASIHYSGDPARGAHAGDLRAVNLEICSWNEHDVRDAKFKFGKLFEKIVSLPCPETAPRKPPPPSLVRERNRGEPCMRPSGCWMNRMDAMVSSTF